MSGWADREVLFSNFLKYERNPSLSFNLNHQYIFKKILLSL